MALPLIAAGVAGVLGGGRYLMNKIDQRSAQESRGKLEQYLEQYPELAEKYPARVDMIRQSADSAMSSGGWLQRDPMSASRGTNGALMAAMNLQANDNAETREWLNRTLEQRRSFEQQDKWKGLEFDYRKSQDALTNQLAVAQELRSQAGEGRQVEDQYWQVLQNIQETFKGEENMFNETQSKVRQTMSMLDNPNMSGMEVYASTLGLLKALMPTEAIMEGDIRAAVEAGGYKASMARLLMRFNKDKTMDDTWREDMRRTLKGVNQEAVTRWGGVAAQANEKAQRWGIDQRDLYKRGGAFYAVPDRLRGQARDRIRDTLPDLPDGFTRTPPRARTRRERSGR